MVGQFGILGVRAIAHFNCLFLSPVEIGPQHELVQYINITNSFRGGDCQEGRTGIVLDRKKGIPAEVNSVASYVNSAVL